MLHVVRQRPCLLGTVKPPGDKSLAHRALICGALADAPLTVRGLPAGDDVASTRRCLETLGVGFEDLDDERVRITPPAEWARGRRLDCGNSGTTARLLAGLLAGLSLPAVLDGDQSLRRRPMSRVANPLQQLGAKIAANPGGRLPMRIGDPGQRLRGGRVELAVASAQVKSAVLLAGLHASGRVTVSEPAASRDHTERLLTAMGADLTRDHLTVTLTPGLQRLHACDLDLPGDMSTAAFFLAAGTIVPGSSLEIHAVGINPTRTGLLDILLEMGARVEMTQRTTVAGEPMADLSVQPTTLQPTVVEGDLVPRLIDELPVLAVVASQAAGTTVVRDAGELRYKESDRIATTVRELRKLGADIHEHDDGFEVHGPTPLRGALVSACGDHRLAMALAVAGLIAEGETAIEGADTASVSHPGFWDDLARLGGRDTVGSREVTA